MVASALLTAAVLCCCKDALETSTVRLFGKNVELPIYMIYNVSFFLLYLVIFLVDSWRPRLR